jgi:hypothetical protein
MPPMRPAKTSQGNLVAPLNRILGTEANVRLLRVLSEAGEPLAQPEVARRAQMDASGVRRALDSLAAEGIVERAGSGARTPVRLREAHPLASALRGLFAEERGRAADIVEDIRQVGAELPIQPRALWLSPPAQVGADSLETMHLAVLAGAREVDGIARTLRDRLREVQRRRDAVIEVRGYTLADLQTLSADARAELAAARPILGPAPAGLLAGDAPPATSNRTWSRGHARQDRRALLLGRAIGERIARDPALIERAREYARRMAASSPGVRLEMEEWEAILDTLPPARLRAFLADPGERATRLRQSLPFLAVLTPAEREDLFRKADRDAQPA